MKAFKSKDRPRQLNVYLQFPRKTDQEVSEELASFFNRISGEFQPLEPSEIPRTHSRTLPDLLPFQVAGRIKAFKMPKSMVRGDIFPALMHKYAAVPLSNLYNEITRTARWPRIWKPEFMTVIPKKRNPEGRGTSGTYPAQDL